MKKKNFATREMGSFKSLSREQLKNVLGGDQCCTCTYGDGSQVDNTCDDGEGISACCGPAGVQKVCFACGT
ncbi:hypothetical protein [Puia sp.]|jgi:hypothetical protein|uniref:hypothetical protein n=1 Tax=Puia sp. TaxID=2045100 RepID=UPI002F42AFE9